MWLLATQYDRADFQSNDFSQGLPDCSFMNCIEKLRLKDAECKNLLYLSENFKGVIAVERFFFLESRLQV